MPVVGQSNHAPAFFGRVLERRGLKMKTKCGDAAVPFELPDIAGQIHRLSEYSGGWLLLVFHRHLG